MLIEEIFIGLANVCRKGLKLILQSVKFQLIQYHSPEPLTVAKKVAKMGQAHKAISYLHVLISCYNMPAIFVYVTITAQWN